MAEGRDKEEGVKEYKYIFFDLDGTVTDPGLGITNSVMYALKGFGIEETDRTKLYRFIGPPLADSMDLPGRRLSVGSICTGNITGTGAFLKIESTTAWKRCWAL